MFSELFSNIFTRILIFSNLFMAIILVGLILYWNMDISHNTADEPYNIEHISGVDNEDIIKSPVQLNNLIERPIFHTTRRAFVAPVYEAPQAPIVAERPSFKLTGIITKQDGTAWVYLHITDDETTVRAKQGDDVDGWQIQSILEDKIIVTKSGAVIEIGETR